MRHLIVIATLGASCIACASSTPPVAKEPVSEPKAAPLQEPEEVPAAKVEIRVDDSIRSACGIENSSTYFAFDSAVILNADYSFMQKLADCFNGGALNGRGLEVVGFADPRGETDYNFTLGKDRAQSVKVLLSGDGMSEQRISATSLGEGQAKGFDETSWAEDRRVELRLDE